MFGAHAVEEARVSDTRGEMAKIQVSCSRIRYGQFHTQTAA
jgi:hypothetical protein